MAEAHSAKEISEHPTLEELQSLVDEPLDKLKDKPTRALENRIFVNRDLRLDDIEYFGYDMDYTLAVYNSPVYEVLGFNLTKKALIDMGYPKEIESFEYDESLPCRGLIMDLEEGNMLKIDQFGYILRCVHGLEQKSRDFIRSTYPAGQIHNQQIGREKRYHFFNTLFELPEIVLISYLIDFFESSAEHPGLAGRSRPGFSYKNIFEDVRGAIDRIHADGTLKMTTIANLETYVRKDERLPILLRRLHRAGKKTFVVTNSEFYYTNAVMEYMLSDFTDEEYPTWRDFFDIAVVLARKPLFFGKGTTLREVDLETGNLKICEVVDRFEKGKVYQGGSLAQFQRLVGCKEEEILYFGDNLFADILMSKKNSCLWRTCLVARELAPEIAVWRENSQLFVHLENLEFIRAKLYRNFDSESNEKPAYLDHVRTMIKDTFDEFDFKFNPKFGSMWRTGSKLTFLAAENQKYADLYASDFLHLLHYPFFYYFSAPSRLLSHETETMAQLERERMVAQSQGEGASSSSTSK